MAWHNRCLSCAILYIQGVRCHETGCPSAWTDEIRECFECGCDFEPENRHQLTCNDCLNPEPFGEEEITETEWEE